MYFGRLLSNWRRIFVALGVLMGSCGVSHAGTVTGLTFADYPNGGSIGVIDALTGTPGTLYDGSSSVHLTLAPIGSFPGSSGDGLNQGGAFGWTGGTFSGADVPFVGTIPITTPIPTALVTFCLEINQNISPGGTYNYTVAALSGAPVGGDPPMGQLAADYIAELWQAHYNDAVGTNASAVNAGAFQLAIWKIEYDMAMSGHAGLTVNGNGSLTANFGTGNFSVNNTSAASVTLAASWLLGLTTPNGIAGDGENMANVWALTNGGTQDQLIGSLVLPGGGSNVITVVPEPASIFMWLLIGSAVGCVSLRRRRLAAAV